MKKNWLNNENGRNERHRPVYVKILCLAYNPHEVVIGHHLLVVPSGRGAAPEEIPSADALIFDHGIMRQVFGDRALEVMAACAQAPAEAREEVLACELARL